jgi:PAS domain S-box-containing protein
MPLNRPSTPLHPGIGQGVANTLAAQVLAGAAGGVGLMLLLVAAWQMGAGANPAVARARMVVGAVLLVGAVVAYALRKKGSWRRAAAVVLLAATLGAGCHAWITGHGVHSIALGACALTIALSGVLANRALSVAMAVLTMAMVAALYLAEQSGSIPGVAVLGSGSGRDRVISHLLLTGGALVAGWVVSHMVASSLTQARAEQLRLASLLRISSDWTWEMNPQFQMVYLAPSFEARTGRTVAEFLLPPANGGPAIVPDADADRVNQALKSRLPYRDCVLNLRCADGTLLTITSSGEPVFDSNGSFAGWWGVSRNITAERQAHKEQARTQALLDRMVRISPDAICMARTATGEIMMTNAGYAELTGYTEAQILGSNAVALGLWPDAERLRFGQALRAGPVLRDFRSKMTLADGRQRELVISAGVFMWDNERVAVITARDITDAERARIESDAILDNASVGIALLRYRRFERVNPAFEAIFGFAPGGLAGASTRVLLPNAAQHDTLLALAHATLGHGQALDVERLMPTTDGRLVLVRLSARPVDAAQPHDAGTIWVVEDITERRRTEAELGMAKQQAEAANDAKSAFLATMSHEIRTPLNGVLGLARLLQDPALASAQRAEYLQHLHNSAEQLTGIVSDVLDMSKIEAGHLQIENIDFDLHALMASVFRSFFLLGQERGLQMHHSVADDVPNHVRGDPVRVRQIVANYLSNALKFTVHGQVELRLTMADSRAVTGAAPTATAAPNHTVRLAVHDTGTGVSEDVQQRLFKPFTQADSSTTRRYGGTGLGLSICHELAQRMGGRVGVQSLGGTAGSGSTGSVFWADLPLPATSPRQAGADPAATPTQPLLGLRVLVAEDNAVNMLIVEAQLRRLGVTVLQAVDGEDAVRTATEHASTLDAVLMDLHMPGLDGLAATRALRANSRTARLPVFALSAAVLDHERQQALDAGMNGFMAKPAAEADLVHVLQQVLGRRLTG